LEEFKAKISSVVVANFCTSLHHTPSATVEKRWEYT
jgi:hypothetical protein